jgi:hypothetical protein
MTDDHQLPLDVEKIECAPLGNERVGVWVSGRWRARRWSPDTGAFLVIQTDGRQHRFPAVAVSRRRRMVRASDWGASFALPASLQAELNQQLSFWVGDLEIPLPRVSYVSDPPSTVVYSDDETDAVVNGVTVAPAGEEPSGEKQHAVTEVNMEEFDEPGTDAPAVQPGQAAVDPPSARVESEQADALVAALRAELRQRAADEARLRAELSETRGELDSRIALQGQLGAIQEELRDEFEQLRKLIDEERASRGHAESRAEVLAAEAAAFKDRLSELAPLTEQLAEVTASRDQAAREAVELRAQLAAIDVAREVASGEAEGLRSEVDRLGFELADARGSDSPLTTELSQAQALLAEARAVRARLRDRAERRPERADD